MGNLLSYSGTTTKIRAMRKSLLSPRDYSEMAAMRSVTELLHYLKNLPAYYPLLMDTNSLSLHRGDIEKILTNAIYLDFQKIYRFTTPKQRHFLDLYFHRYEVSILKTCIRMIFDHRDVTINLQIFADFWQKHSVIDLTLLSQSQSPEDFCQVLQGSLYEPALTRLQTLDAPALWDYEMALDLFYFKWFWKKGEKTLDKEQIIPFKNAYGTKMDLLNINWIYRSKYHFRMEETAIYAHLISIMYQLKKEEIIALTQAQTKEEFEHVLQNTYYGRRYKDYTISTLESSYVVIRQHIQRKAAKNDPYSTATVISYLFEKEQEIDKITTILEGVRYGLSRNQILDYINIKEKGAK